MRMPTLSLPIRIHADGRLERTDPVAGLLRLFRAMAASPAGSWKHARWFGLQEIFAGANVLLEDQQQIADALNVALGELGVGWARVLSVQTVRGEAYGERCFRLTLTVDGRHGAVHETLEV